MGRFHLQDLLDLLRQFGIFLIPLVLALLGPLFKKFAESEAAKKAQTPKPRDPAGRERVEGERVERERAAERAGGGEPIGRMKRIEGRMQRMEGRMSRMEQPDRPVTGSQLPDEGMVIAEVRRLLDKRSREVASESARWSPADPGPETQATLTAPRHVAPPEASRHREMPVEGQAPLSHDFESVSEKVKDHLTKSLDARESLKGASLPSQDPKAAATAPPLSARQKTAAISPAARAIASPEFRRLIRKEPLLVLVAAEVFGPCRAAAGLEGSPMAPTGLRPWGATKAPPRTGQRRRDS